MNCETNQQTILDRDWDEATLHEAAALLEHIRGCEPCRTALADHDRLRGFLHAPDDDAAPRGGWRQFEETLCEPVHAHTVEPDVRRNGVHGRVWMAALAASLLAAVAGWASFFQVNRMLARQHSSPPEETVEPPSQRAAWPAAGLRLTSADIDHGVQLYRNVQEVVEGRAGWVAVSADATELGIAPEPTAVNANVVVLRLALARDGQTAARTDLVMLPGQSVRLSVPLQDTKTVHYEVQSSDTSPVRVSVRAEVLESNGHETTIAALATRLTPTAGEMVRAGGVQTADGGYELAMGYARQTLPEVTP